jgi:hypothetical protein
MISPHIRGKSVRTAEMGYQRQNQGSRSAILTLYENVRLHGAAVPHMSQEAAVFITYRRDDAAGHAGRLHDRLTNWLNPEDVFFDLGHIKSGDDFPKRIRDAVRAAKVVLVLITPDWLPQIKRRATLHEVDFVRAEVELALDLNARHGIPKVIPVLLGGAHPVTRSDLVSYPKMRRLADLDAHEFQGKNADFDHHFERLREIIAGAPGMPVPRFVDRVKLRRLAARIFIPRVLLGALLAAMVGSFFIGPPVAQQLPAPSAPASTPSAPVTAKSAPVTIDSGAGTADPQRTVSSESTAQPAAVEAPANPSTVEAAVDPPAKEALVNHPVEQAPISPPARKKPPRHFEPPLVPEVQPEESFDPQDLDLKTLRELKSRY